MLSITCKVCDTGSLHRKSVPLMTPTVRLIGRILLVPSFLGMLIGAFLAVAAIWNGLAWATQPNDAKQEMRGWSEERVVVRYLELQGVPTAQAERLVETRDAEEAFGFRPTGGLATKAGAALGWLSTPENDAIEWFKGKPTSGPPKTASSFIGGALTGLSVIIGSLVSGLLGFLLTMKRQALACNHCGALTPSLIIA